ncbi:MAG: RC-LH1 core complex protein PufX [Pararhodobacter sp.]|nr:RC-LH1 core complex protein PufX [Pararhodobacter sp.]
MSDLDYTGQTRTGRLRSWILSEMLRGAGYTAAVLLAIGLILGAIRVVAWFLPEDSQNAPPPMPFSQIVEPFDSRLG